jgi:hypothetical protein
VCIVIPPALLFLLKITYVIRGLMQLLFQGEDADFYYSGKEGKALE